MILGVAFICIAVAPCARRRAFVKRRAINYLPAIIYSNRNFDAGTKRVLDVSTMTTTTTIRRIDAVSLSTILSRVTPRRHLKIIGYTLSGYILPISFNSRDGILR